MRDSEELKLNVLTSAELANWESPMTKVHRLHGPPPETILENPTPHTPANWMIIQEGRSTIGMPVCVMYDDAEKRKRIVIGHGSDWGPTNNRVDAQLIAAAPQLYEACRAALTVGVADETATEMLTKAAQKAEDVAKVIKAFG